MTGAFPIPALSSLPFAATIEASSGYQRSGACHA